MHVSFKVMHPSGFKRCEPHNSYQERCAKHWRINKIKRFTSPKLKRAARRAGKDWRKLYGNRC